MIGQSHVSKKIITAHNAMAAGTATTRPRAKLRPGPKRGSRAMRRFSGGDSVMTITLSISKDLLLLLGQLIQPANRAAPCTTRYNSQATLWVPGSTRPYAPRRFRYLLSGAMNLWQLADLALRLAPARDPQTEGHPVIYAASGRPGRGQPRISARVAIFLALMAAPRMAAAQADEVETPTEMFEPEKGQGLPLAPGLILYNHTLLLGEYDSNIYNVEQNRTNDTIGLLKSDFRLATRMSRHEVEVLAGTAIRRYAETSEENSETYYAAGRTFLDLADRTAIRIEGGYARGVEKRGTAGDVFATDRPIRYDDGHLEAKVERTGGILEASLTGSIRHRKYQDASIGGLPVDLGNRDASVQRVTAQAGYRVSPVLRLHGQIGGNQVKYDRNIGFSRDSSGYSALIGVRYEVTRLVDVTAAVGYMHQSFEAPGTESVSGLSYRVAGSWTPTPMWRVTVAGERVVDSSPLDNVPAIVRGNFDLKVQRALGDRMLVEASVAYTDEDYRGFGRHDRRYATDVNVQYRVTKNIAAVVGAGYRKQTGGREYSGATASAGLRIAL